MLIYDVIPNQLQQPFKNGWNKQFPNSPWTRNAASGQNFVTHKRKKKMQMKDKKVERKIKNGYTDELDSLTLFFAAQYSHA